MRSASWARTAARLRRNAEELKSYDFEVVEPPNFEVPPHRRTGRPSAIVVEEGAAGADVATDSAPVLRFESGE